jgi:hypothetical protein
MFHGRKLQYVDLRTVAPNKKNACQFFTPGMLPGARWPKGYSDLMNSGEPELANL